jgi:hypothetical protein
MSSLTDQTRLFPQEGVVEAGNISPIVATRCCARRRASRSREDIKTDKICIATILHLRMDSKKIARRWKTVSGSRPGTDEAVRT